MRDGFHPQHVPWQWKVGHIDPELILWNFAKEIPPESLFVKNRYQTITFTENQLKVGPSPSKKILFYLLH